MVTTTPSLCGAGQGTRGFIHAEGELYQVSYISSLLQETHLDPRSLSSGSNHVSAFLSISIPFLRFLSFHGLHSHGPQSAHVTSFKCLLLQEVFLEPRRAQLSLPVLLGSPAIRPSLSSFLDVTFAMACLPSPEATTASFYEYSVSL